MTAMGPLKSMVDRLELQLCEKVEEVVALKLEVQELKHEKITLQNTLKEKESQLEQSDQIYEL
jgi:FtsZ-binding cell division protein ZapB